MRKDSGEVFGLVFIVFILLFLTGFASCAKTQSQQTSDPQALVMTACTTCHDNQRTCDALAKKDKDAWTQTVTRMKDKGAAVPAANIPDVIDYLAGLKPGSPPVCK